MESGDPEPSGSAPPDRALPIDLPRLDPLPVHAPTGTEAADFDRRAIEELGVPEPALMERAGSQAAAWIVGWLRGGASRRPITERDPVLVLAGSGHNGGDALVLARSLQLWGVPVRVLHTGGEPADPGLLHGHRIASDPAGELDDAELARRLDSAPLLIDGMLGTGARGAPRGEPARILAHLAGARAPGASASSPVVALDLPTGVDPDTGRVEGEAGALRAEVTLAFGWPKLGTLLHPGRARAGRIVALEIGFPPLGAFPFRYRILTRELGAAQLPRRDPVTHKNRVGSLLVAGGRRGMAGATLLAGRAALRAGVGYIRIASDPANREVVQSALPEAVWVEPEAEGSLAEAIEGSSALAVGPGMGTDPAAGALLGRLLEGPPRPTVLDADALTLLAAGAVSLPLDRPVVLTPHPGEAARLLGCTPAEIEADRPAALDRLREETGAVVLLKGTPSLIGGEGRWLDPYGSSDLALAGMGDLLTGTLGSLLAQGVEAEAAAGLSLLLTGGAARRAGHGVGLQAADIPDALPGAIASLRGGAWTRRDPHLPWVVLDLEAAR